jgi:hypothetical protein
MRRSLIVLSLVLAACGTDAPPPPSESAPVVETVTPPPGAYDSDPAAAPQEPLPDGVQARPAATPTPAIEAKPVVKDAPAAPVPTGPMSVTELTLAREVVDRAPKGVTDRFAEGAEVNCYTRIDNPNGGLRAIRHQYYFGDELKRSLELKVKGTTWRTWSNKRVYGRGDWRVDVVDEAGTVLATKPFVVK